MYVSDPQKSHKDSVSFEELRNVTPLAGLVWLDTIGNETADLHYHSLITTVNSQRLNESIIAGGRGWGRLFEGSWVQIRGFSDFVRCLIAGLHRHALKK